MLGKISKPLAPVGDVLSGTDFPFWLGSRFSKIYRSDGQRRLLRLNAEFLGFNHLSDPPQDRGQQFI
jgi:hypothetical protein